MRKALLTAMILFVITPLPSVWGEVNFAVSDPDDGEHLLYVSSGDMTWTANVDSDDELLYITSDSGTGDITAVLDATAPDYDGEITWTTGSNSITYNLAEGDKTMFSFMFGVLGSVFFWAAYLGLGIFATTLGLKKYAPRTWGAIKSGDRSEWHYTGGPEFLLIPVWFLFWPLVFIAILIGLVAKLVFFTGLQRAFVAADRLMPEVSFNKKSPQED